MKILESESWFHQPENYMGSCAFKYIVPSTLDAGDSTPGIVFLEHLIIPGGGNHGSA